MYYNVFLPYWQCVEPLNVKLRLYGYAQQDLFYLTEQTGKRNYSRHRFVRYSPIGSKALKAGHPSRQYIRYIFCP